MSADFLFMFAYWILGTPIAWAAALITGFLVVMVAVIAFTEANSE